MKTKEQKPAGEQQPATGTDPASTAATTSTPADTTAPDAPKQPDSQVAALLKQLSQEREARERAEQQAREDREARELAEQTAEAAGNELVRVAAELDAATASAERKKPVILIDGKKFQVNAKRFYHPKKHDQVVTLAQLREDVELQRLLVKKPGILTPIE